MSKNMCRTIAIVAVLIVAFSFAGCGPSAISDGGGEGQGTVVSSSSEGASHDMVKGEERAALPTDDVRFDDTAEMGTVTYEGKTYEPKDSVINILLLGVDSDAERVKQRMGWRSDMLMLVTMDTESNKITLTSIPRDTWATVAHVNDKGQVTEELEEKINHAYAYGGGPTKYSAENSMRAVEKLLEWDGMLHVPIDHYISIDLDGLPKLADALDGVTVTLDQNVPDVGKNGETVTLSGNKVRKYLENRYDMTEGEFSRQQNEQTFIESMAKKIKDMGARKAAPSLYEAFVKFMRTNLSLDEVLELADALDQASLDSIEFVRMENGHPEVVDAVWYYRASQDEMVPKMLEVLYTEV